MKRLIPIFIFAVSFTIFPATVWGIPRLTAEPPLESLNGWNISPSGMLVVAYDLDHNGKSDFFAVRVVIDNYFSTDTVHQTQENFPTSLVFQVSYERDSYFYITAKQPLFYAMDTNEDGVWDLLYKDEMEDGVNGNEKLYDSPSGLFSENLKQGGN